MRLLQTYRIECADIVIRCYSPADAPLMLDALIASQEHLLPWMPWAKTEVYTLEAMESKLRLFRSKYDAGADYIMGIFNAQETELLGGTGLHTRLGNAAYEIGYWIHAHHINKGLATRVSAALTAVAFDIEECNRVEIHCDPRNSASARVPEKLGFVHETTLAKRIADADDILRDSMIWTMFKEQYLENAVSSTPYLAYSCSGALLGLKT